MFLILQHNIIFPCSTSFSGPFLTEDLSLHDIDGNESLTVIIIGINYEVKFGKRLLNQNDRLLLKHGGN